MHTQRSTALILPRKPYYPAADNDYLATHELGNALGLLDYYGPVVPWKIPAQYTNSDYTAMAGETFNTNSQFSAWI